MAAEIHLMKTNAELSLAETFAAVGPSLPGDAGIAAQRAKAFDSFAATGLPHRRVESWRYTDLRALMREAMPLAAPPSPEALAKAPEAAPLLAGAAYRRLYVVNGSFVPALSDLADLEPGLSIRGLAAALTDGDGLVAAHLGKTLKVSDPALALNTALMGDGVVVQVAAGAKVSRPLALIFVSTEASASAMFTRSLLVLEKGAGLSLIECHEGPDGVPYQVNTALELVVADGAQFARVKLTREGDQAVHLSTLLTDIGAGARFTAAAFTTGGAVVRNQLLVRLSGEGTEARMSGVSLLAGRQHADTMLEVEHAAAHCESRESFRAVLDGTSRDVFQGRICVKPGAQKTDARMMSRALLLSDTAEADNKPELEIFADDVQCGHGCTTGSLDQQIKFYLMARGIPEKEAEALLIQAFVGEVIDAIADEGVRAALTEATQSWLMARE